MHVGRPLKRVCRRQYRATGHSPGCGRDTGTPFVVGTAERERECVERADEEGTIGEEGAISIGPIAIAIAACRSTGRSRTTAWRATRASYAYRSPFAKSARAPSPPPPSRSRRTVIVSVSSDRCRKRRARRASLGMPPIVTRPPSVTVGRHRCSSRRCVRTLGRLE